MRGRGTCGAGGWHGRPRARACGPRAYARRMVTMRLQTIVCSRGVGPHRRGSAPRKDAGLRTAALVLAILASVFGALGAIIAVLFGSFAETVSFGLGGTGIARNATWAFAALAIGIVGTVLVGRRPRVAAAILVAAAVIGILGTASFVVGSLLYAIAAGLAFFQKPTASATASIARPTSAGPLPASSGSPGAPSVVGETEGGGAGVPTPTSSAYRGPKLGRRSMLLAAAAAILVVAIVVISAVVGQASEQRPATALFDALQAGDDAALAGLLPAAARTGNTARDAQTALRAALGNSSLAFLTEDWLRSLGPATGTKMAFENLKTTTISKTDSGGVVRMTGVFSPSNPNPLVNFALQAARVGFSADIQTMRSGSTWFLDSSALAVAATPAPISVAVTSTRAPTAPPPPTPSPAPKHLMVGTYVAPPSATLTTQGWRMTLRSVTVNLDESVVFALELVVGPADGPWAGRESVLMRSDGVALQLRANASSFYDGGKGAGAVIPVALAFPSGLAGGQPYELRVCGNLGFCWPSLVGPVVPER
jgi:hypothetical protein